VPGFSQRPQAATSGPHVRETHQERIKPGNFHGRQSEARAVGMPLIRLACVKPNRAISAGAFFTGKTTRDIKAVLAVEFAARKNFWLLLISKVTLKINLVLSACQLTGQY
jgi:hypothetical protein